MPNEQWRHASYSSASTRDSQFFANPDQIVSSHEFYTWIHAVKLSYYDPYFDPVMTCFHIEDCRGTQSALMAPEALDDFRYLSSSCWSFEVPTGTSLKVYRDDDNYGTTGNGSWLTIEGQDPINDNGDMECINAGFYSQRQEFYRTAERP